jgi:hypothetical protein
VGAESGSSSGPTHRHYRSGGAATKPRLQNLIVCYLGRSRQSSWRQRDPSKQRAGNSIGSTVCAAAKLASAQICRAGWDRFHSAAAQRPHGDTSTANYPAIWRDFPGIHAKARSPAPHSVRRWTTDCKRAIYSPHAKRQALVFRTTVTSHVRRFQVARAQVLPCCNFVPSNSHPPLPLDRAEPGARKTPSPTKEPQISRKDVRKDCNVGARP